MAGKKISTASKTVYVTMNCSMTVSYTKSYYIYWDDVQILNIDLIMVKTIKILLHTANKIERNKRNKCLKA